MTTITCSKDCKYQKDGLCCLERVTPLKVMPDLDGAYFLEKEKESYS